MTRGCSTHLQGWNEHSLEVCSLLAMKCTLSIYIDKFFQLQKELVTNCCQFVIMHMTSWKCNDLKHHWKRNAFHNSYALGMLSQLFHIRSVEDIEGFQSNNLEFHFIFWSALFKNQRQRTKIEFLCKPAIYCVLVQDRSWSRQSENTHHLVWSLYNFCSAKTKHWII